MPPAASAIDKAMDQALELLLTHGSAIVILIRAAATDETYTTKTRASGDPALMPQMLDDAAEVLCPDCADDDEE